MSNLPLFKISSGPDDIQAITRVIESKMNWAVGPEVEEFERQIAGYVGTKYALTLNSGTSAIYASLLAAGISSDDEVIVPAFTYIATIEPISLVGATPVFADIEEKTLGLDPKDVEKKITKKTRALVVVHYAGLPCQIKKLSKIAKKHKLILIEDAAEAFGSAIADKKLGSIGDVGIFSFSQGKIITTGEGGAIVTNSKRIYDKLKLIRSLGRKEPSDTTHTGKNGDFISLGFNFRLSNILAALGNSQIKKTAKVLDKRMRLANEYFKHLDKFSQIKVLRCKAKNTCGYQIFPILVKDRDNLQKYLAKKNISSRVYFPSIFEYELYTKYKTFLPVTEKISSSVLCLPFHADMTKSEVTRVVVSITKFYSNAPSKGF